MKKLIQLTTVLSFTFVLGACAPKADQATTESSFTITLNEDGKKISSDVLKFEKGDFLQDIMEENFDVLEENGMITSINGHASDASKQKYWMYDVNGKMAEVGAKEFELTDGDDVVWNLAVLKMK